MDQIWQQLASAVIKAYMSTAVGDGGKGGSHTETILNETKRFTRCIWLWSGTQTYLAVKRQANELLILADTLTVDVFVCMSQACVSRVAP